MDVEPVPKLLSINDVVARVLATKWTIYGWMRNGAFPPARYLGEGLVAWRERDIDEWIDGRQEWCPGTASDPPEERVVVAVAPIGLDREQALAYTGLSIQAFRRLQLDGRIIGKPVGPNGRMLYLRANLDEELERLFEVDGPDTSDWFD